MLTQKIDLDDDLFELDAARRPAELRLMAPPAAALDGVAEELAQYRTEKPFLTEHADVQRGALIDARPTRPG